MQTLIIILIVVLIAQTGVFIYANFIDLSNKRNAADTQKMRNTRGQSPCARQGDGENTAVATLFKDGNQKRYHEGVLVTHLMLDDYLEDYLDFDFSTL